MELEKEALKGKLKEYNDNCLGDLVPLDQMGRQFRMPQPNGTHHMTHQLKSHSEECVERKLSAVAQDRVLDRPGFLHNFFYIKFMPIENTV